MEQREKKYQDELITASDDDIAPSLKLWDMRHMLTPVKEFVGHTKDYLKWTMMHLAAAIDQIESNILRCPDSKYVEEITDAIDFVHVQGDSVGGVITCIVRSVHTSINNLKLCIRELGSPVFDKLEVELPKLFDLLEMLKKKEEMFSAVKERQQKLFLMIVERNQKLGIVMLPIRAPYANATHLSHEDDEDDDDDAAIEKARRFDDRKDDNPRDAGNSKLTTFG
ncbi:hypothetical protein ACFE04_023903 [Oxalis oulophora]